MVRAVWTGEVIAESDDTVVVEGNHYFPIESVRVDLLRPSSKKTVCSWKGAASYHDLFVGGKENRDAVWFYPEPKSAAAAIKDRVAFWRGVTIEADAAPTTDRSLLSRFRRHGDERVASELGVMSIPTLVLCDLDGNEVDRIVGLPDSPRLSAFVERAEQLAQQGSNTP